MNDEEKKAIVELKHLSNMTAYWKQEEYTNSEIDNYINKIIHIYRYGERLCDIAKNYNTTPYKILADSKITSIEMMSDYTPLIINIDTKCTEKEQIYCNEEKRGCHGCYYFK